MVTLNGQALSNKFSRETDPFIIVFVFIKILTDSKQNTVTQIFVGQTPFSFTSICHLILMIFLYCSQNQAQASSFCRFQITRSQTQTPSRTPLHDGSALQPFAEDATQTTRNRTRIYDCGNQAAAKPCLIPHYHQDRLVIVWDQNHHYHCCCCCRRSRVTYVSNRLNHQVLNWQNRAPEADYDIQLQCACSHLLLIPDRMAGQPDDLM